MPVIADAQQPSAQRTRSGLILLYDFEDVANDSFQDASGVSPQLRIKIQNKSSVVHASGAVEFKSSGIVKSDEITPRIAAAIIRSGEVTFEAWIHPANVSQKGPSRVFTYSRSSVDRSFTMGQEGNKFDFRVRSTQTDNNGLPSLSSSSGSVKTELTHLVYTRDRTGRSRIYLNGKLDVEKMMPGDLTNWTADFHLAVGNEMDGNRPWLGKVHLLAIYQRDLLPQEVRHHFELGPNASTPQAKNENRNRAGEPVSSDHFTSNVAPIIAPALP